MEGPTKEWIDAAKEKYGRLSRITINGVMYIFRQLKRKEHLDIQKTVFPTGVPTDQALIKPEENTQIEDMIVKSCVLWPENLDFNNEGAGVPQSITPSILFFSGFVGPQEPEEI
jgi:hypothetical protein